MSDVTIKRSATGRDLSLDLIRILACLMVVMMHSPVPLTEGQYSPMLGAVSYLMVPCNGLFFMVSGALLFGRGLSFGAFMKRRLARIVFPVVAWSVIYILLQHSLTNSGGVINDLLVIPFWRTNACGYLWFMYALLGCYFLVPIVEPWLMKAGRRELETVILLWMGVAVMPMLTVYLGVPKVDEQSAWYYFSGFFGYFLLGYYASRYSFSIKKIIASAFVTVVLMAVSFMQRDVATDINCYLHPYVIAFCFTLFVSVRKMTASKTRLPEKVITSLSACTFGVYLVHSLVLNHILKRMDWISSFSIEAGILIRWALTILIAFGFILLLRKVKGHKYLIG